ncbi:MAG: flagellar biosynthesis anti-sigma factor FlgM [Armatimonadetes bacterium]|jgi:flagellar biosynthesis anti-sigma factor FlgM|nr:flagellar biosynthesis anti-sigma factor FlgM [Armatimonadota bacterium]
MKISGVESNKACVNQGAAQEKILPKNRPKGLVSSQTTNSTQSLSPLEQGMVVAEAALRDVPETRDEVVMEIKDRIAKGDYNVSGAEIADMMLRRRAADKIR